jgi:hypothetical protein
MGKRRKKREWRGMLGKARECDFEVSILRRSISPERRTRIYGVVTAAVVRETTTRES